MVILFVGLLAYAENLGHWNIGETGIYGFPMILVTENSVVITEIEENKIWYFDKKTLKKKELTRLGQAPHEFGSPYVKIFSSNTSIWIDVLGHNKVLEFSDSGDFIRSFKVPVDLFHLWKGQNGWIAMTGLSAGSWEKPTCLVYLDNEFSTREVIKCWASEEDRGSAFTLNPRSMLYDPTASRTMLLPFKNNRYFAIQIANLDSFCVFDSEKQKVILEKKVDFPHIKFDREWGEKELEKQNKHWPAGFKQKAHFPDYFPRIKFVVGTEWGHVLVHQWNIASKKDQYVTYDLKGNLVNKHELAKCSYQIVKLEGEDAYFRFLQEDESWSVGLLPFDELLELHKKKPFKFAFPQ